MSEQVRVCPESELGPGDRKFVTVDGTTVGVLNVGGELYALENECPHQHGPVCSGKVGPALEGEFVAVGERVVERLDQERMAVSCPYHGWEFDLETGEHLGDDEYSVQTYAVVVEDETVFIQG